MAKEKTPPDQAYQGTRYRVVHCEGALKSFQKAIRHVKAGKARPLTRHVVLQIERLADGLEMSKANFPQEGVLPKANGQHHTKHFFALKRVPIRGYCWLSERVPNTWFISHYVYKDYEKLDPADTEKVGRNWRRVEEDGHEY